MDYLSLSEVAYELGIERPRVWRLIESGQLPLWRDGKQLVVMRQDLDEYLWSREVDFDGSGSAG